MKRFSMLTVLVILAMGIQSVQAQTAKEPAPSVPRATSLTEAGAIESRTAIGAEVLQDRNIESRRRAQIAPPAQVTGVRLETTDAGLTLILETAGAPLPIPTTRVAGNALIADIPNARLSKEFQQERAIAGIASIGVSQLPGDRVRVTITGNDAPPTAQINAAPTGLAFAVANGTTTATERDEELEIVVTGTKKEVYNPSTATTGTRTDTPLRDVPRSVQVIPRQVIEDQGVTRIEDALRNVSGVTIDQDPRSTSPGFNIRGFELGTVIKDGFASNSGGNGLSGRVQLPNSIERIEVLKGPEAVLYGASSYGGTVNFISKQPLTEPRREAKFTAGSNNFYQSAIDLTGPLTEDKNLLYRFNAAYQRFGSFADNVNGDIISIAPTVSYRFNDNTNLKFEYEYSQSQQVPYSGLPLSPIAFGLPININYNSPDDRISYTSNTATLTLNHKLSENLQLRSAVRANFDNSRAALFSQSDFDPSTNEVRLFYSDFQNSSSRYSWQNSLTADFNTGSVKHQALAAVDLSFGNSKFLSPDYAIADSDGDGIIDIDGLLRVNVFNSQSTNPQRILNIANSTTNPQNTAGIVLQDLVTLSPNVKLLVGGRYDFVKSDSQRSSNNLLTGEQTESNQSQSYSQFSPRVGVVYQPIEPLSLYASYSRSFAPQFGIDRSSNPYPPLYGTQYEIGTKLDLGNAAATLSAYQIDSANVLFPDPTDNNFSVPLPGQQNRGIELDVSGKILPGWNVIASAYLNDTRITDAGSFATATRGTALSPTTGTSLWTTYEIQSGNLQGLGFGLGAFYVGDRVTRGFQPDGEIEFGVPAYVRLDTSLSYRKGDWDARLNFKNLLNNRAYEFSSYGIVPSGFTVQGKVSVRF